MSNMKSYTDFIVNISQIRNNILNIKKHIGNDVKFCAVVKANAYSHGLISIARNISDIVDYFAVACLKEAETIRLVDKKTNILILSRVEKDDLAWCRENNVCISIGSYLQLIHYGEELQGVKIHLQVNTGLNRFGFRSIVEFKKSINYIDTHSFVLEGVYSHFATKSEDKSFIKRQNYKFMQFKNILKDRDIIFHIANSYVTIFSKDYHYNMVRNGFLMYGCTGEDIGNKSAIEIKSQVIHIGKVRKGDTIGYDRTYRAKSSMTIAVVPVGYADGFDRNLSNNFSVLINGKWCKVVGLVCMDVFMVDITDMDISVGDKVTLLGKDGDNMVTLNHYAQALHTSPYAVLLGFNYKRMNYILKNK